MRKQELYYVKLAEQKVYVQKEAVFWSKSMKKLTVPLFFFQNT